MGGVVAGRREAKPCGGGPLLPVMGWNIRLLKSDLDALRDSSKQVVKDGYRSEA